jgi:hypothetical protein
MKALLRVVYEGAIEGVLRFLALLPLALLACLIDCLID